MGIILCIPLIAVIFTLVVWITLREAIPFHRLPVEPYRKMLESITFFIPAGAAGWFSASLAQVGLEDGGKVLNLGWMIGMLISFSILGILELAVGIKKAPKGMGDHDFIALGLGFLAGVLFGTYQVMILHKQPPQFSISCVMMLLHT